MKKIASLLILCSAIAYGTEETPKIRIYLCQAPLASYGLMASEEEKTVKVKTVITELNETAVGKRNFLGCVVTSDTIKHVHIFDLPPTEEKIGLFIDSIDAINKNSMSDSGMIHFIMQPLSQDHYEALRQSLEEKLGKNKAINIKFKQHYRSL